MHHRNVSDYWAPAFAGATEGTAGNDRRKRHRPAFFFVIARLDSGSRVYPTSATLNNAQLGQARVAVRSSTRDNRRMGDGQGYYIYILASKIGGTLYVGVTNDLVRRVFEHRSDVVDGFTKQYGVHHLVYFEQFDDIENAIRREKRIKKWNRKWKVRLIEESNPNWTDLYPNIARQ